MKEIERKYLLKDSITVLIDKLALKKHKIKQYYTTITPSKGVRYRKMDDHYFKTIKKGKGASRDEKEFEITKETFEKKLKKCIKKPLQKERYFLELEGREYSIDVFKKRLKGLYLLEVEFPDIESFETFDLPKILQMHVLKDVSFDEAFKNKNLVLEGRPDDISKVEKIFIDLDAKSHDKLENYFISNLSPIDALRVILYKYSNLILYYKTRILKNEDEEDLHQFRINIRKSRAFLKEFETLFPTKEYTYFYDNLSYFASQTNHKRDLDVIQERFKALKKDGKPIQKDIKNQSEKEQRKIEEMLEGKMFENFFHTYQNALKKETLLTSYNTNGTIEDTVKNIIMNLHQKIIKKIDSLEKDFNEKKLHKIRISFKKLRYLLEEFQHIFGEKKIETMIDKGKKLQNLLGDFNDMVNQSHLMHDYLRSKEGSISNAKQLEDSFLDDISVQQQKLLLQTKKKLHKFKNKAFKF